MQSFLDALKQSLCTLGFNASIGFYSIVIDECIYYVEDRGKRGYTFDYSVTTKGTQAGLQECVLHVITTIADKRAEYARHQAARLLMQGVKKHKNIIVNSYGQKFEATVTVEDAELMASVLEAITRVLDVHQIGDSAEQDIMPDEGMPELHYTY